MTQKITPFLWFNNNAEEAMQFYISVFKNSKIVFTMPGGPDGKILTGTFEIDGQQFHVLNGGPQFTFTEAVSFFISCEDQAEVDELWDKLLAGGGTESQCGWLKDKFGLSWQVVPKVLSELMNNADPVKAQRVFQAMMKMKKIDVATLEKASRGE